MIDAHHHLWRYNPDEYGWIDDSMALLRRDYLPEEFSSVTRRCGVVGSVAVQARQTLGETEWLLQLAADVSGILGVVGWVPLQDPSVSRVIAALEQNPLLKGVRHVVQDEPEEDFLLREDFNRGFQILSQTRLVFDLLVRVTQLPATNIFVRRYPQQRFVLDHMAKPDIRGGQNLDLWRAQIRELAAAPNVFCKLSGLATEAQWNSWTLDQLRPFLDTALEAFGPERVMAGSDWPVCLVATGYERWWEALQQWCAPLDPAARGRILGRNALEFYSLALPGEQ